MGGDDRAHISGVEAERLDLPDGRLTDLITAPEDPVQGPELPRIACVLDPEASVEEDQAVVTLDQQAVADDFPGLEQSSFSGEQPAPVRAHRAAVEMVDAHADGAVYARFPGPGALSLAGRRSGGTGIRD